MPICTLGVIVPKEVLINTTCSSKGECSAVGCSEVGCRVYGCSEFCENSDRNIGTINTASFIALSKISFIVISKVHILLLIVESKRKM